MSAVRLHAVVLRPKHVLSPSLIPVGGEGEGGGGDGDGKEVVDCEPGVPGGGDGDGGGGDGGGEEAVTVTVIFWLALQ